MLYDTLCKLLLVYLKVLRHILTDKKFRLTIHQLNQATIYVSVLLYMLIKGFAFSTYRK